jgi:hypothetical protein
MQLRREFLGLVFTEHVEVWRDVQEMSIEEWLDRYPQLKIDWVSKLVRQELPRWKRLYPFPLIPMQWIKEPQFSFEFHLPLRGDLILCAHKSDSARTFDRQQHAVLSSKLKEYHRGRQSMCDTENRIWVAYAYWFVRMTPTQILDRAKDVFGGVHPTTLYRWLEDFAREVGGFKIRPRGFEQESVRLQGSKAKRQHS